MTKQADKNPDQVTDLRQTKPAATGRHATLSNTVLLPLTAIAFAVAIFLIDTFTPLGIAVAALYVVVVLMAGRFLQRRGVLLVAAACISLTVLAYSIQHWGTYGPALVRCLVSLVAIVITTFLALKSQAAGLKLREQASLLDITHDAVIVRDMNDVITYWNRGAEELYGCPREKAIGHLSHELLQTAFAEPLEEIKAALISTGRWEGELAQRRCDDSRPLTVASRWSLQQDERGRPVATLETSNDITQRKKAENALRRSEAYLVEAQKLSQTGSFGWDVASGRISWSDEAFRIFEYDPSVTPTMDLVLARTHPEDRILVERLMERVKHEPPDWEIEHRLLMPDDTVKYINVVAHLGSEPSGMLEYVGALMDVTAAQHAQEALQRAQAELAHVTRVTTLGELTASIAHEVNQPLAAIVTNGEASLRWLGLKPPELDEARGAVERVIGESHRASEVIKRLRELTRKTNTQMRPLGVNGVINDVVALVQREVLSHHVQLRLDLRSDLKPVTGDRIQLQQVLINLIMNGIEAMASVTERPRTLSIRSALHDTDHVVVTVEDSGVGIDDKTLDHLCQAFVTTKEDGMGMGLSICRSIVEMHGGMMWMLSNDGVGASFQFTIPIHDEDAS